MKEWKKIYHASTNHKKAGATILTSYNVNFRTRKIARDKRKYFIIIQALIYREAQQSQM